MSIGTAWRRFQARNDERLARSETWASIQATFDGSTLAGVRLEEDLISYGDDGRRLRGITASVDTAGQITSRLSATRLVGTSLLGVGALGLFWRKDVDQRELYLLIDGPDFQWLVPVDPKLGQQARTFAARVNTAARQQA